MWESKAVSCKFKCHSEDWWNPGFEDFVKIENLLWWQISTLPPVHKVVRLSCWFSSGLLMDSSWDMDCNFEYAFPEGQGRRQEMYPLTCIDSTYCAFVGSLLTLSETTLNGIWAFIWANLPAQTRFRDLPYAGWQPPIVNVCKDNNWSNLRSNNGLKKRNKFQHFGNQRHHKKQCDISLKYYFNMQLKKGV